MDELSFSVMRSDALDDDLRQDIVKVCVDAHQNPEFYNLFNFVTDCLHVMAYWERTVIGHAMVSVRWMQPEGLPILRSAYIDAVSVIRPEQNKGFGKRIMKQVAWEISDYEIAGLETDVPHFYEQLGWELWRGPLAGRGANGLIPTPEQTGVMILRLPKTPPLNINGLLTIEDQGARIW